MNQGKDKLQEMIPISSSSTSNPVIDLSRTKQFTSACRFPHQDGITLHFQYHDTGVSREIISTVQLTFSRQTEKICSYVNVTFCNLKHRTSHTRKTWIRAFWVNIGLKGFQDSSNSFYECSEGGDKKWNKLNRQCCLVVLADWKICNYVDVTCTLKHRITHTSRIWTKDSSLGLTLGWRCFRSISPSFRNASRGGRQMKWAQSMSSAAWYWSWNFNYVNVTFCMWNTESDILTKHEPRSFSFGLTFGWRCFRSVASSSMDALRGRQAKWSNPEVSSISNAGWLFWWTERFGTMSMWLPVIWNIELHTLAIYMNKSFFVWANIGLKVFQVNSIVFYVCSDKMKRVQSTVQLDVLAEQKICNYVNVTFGHPKRRISHTRNLHEQGLPSDWRCFRSIAASSFTNAPRGRWPMKQVRSELNEQCSFIALKDWKTLKEIHILAIYMNKGSTFELTLVWRCFRSRASSSSVNKIVWEVKDNEMMRACVPGHWCRSRIRCQSCHQIPIHHHTTSGLRV